MADSNIGSLPAAESLNDDSLLVAEQSGAAVHFRGKLLKDYAKQGVDAYVTEAVKAANEAKAAAEDAQEAVGQIGTAVEDTQANAAAAESAKSDAMNAKVAAEQAAESASAAIDTVAAAKEAAEEASRSASANATDAAAAKSAAEAAQSAAETAKTNAEIAGTTAATKAAEAAQSAQSAADDKAAAATSATNAEAARQAIENMIVEAVTSAHGDPASVTKEIVDGVVKLIFGLPSGAKGDKGDPGATITSIIRTSGTGAPGTVDTYTINLSDGTTGGTFNVYNGADGEGAGDMTATVYDPQGKATDIFQYVDDEIDKLPTPDVSAQIKAHDESEDAHPDIRDAIRNVSVTTDAVPTNGSSNPVQSGGVYNALQNVDADNVKFADGETFQQKLDSGELKGEDGVIGKDGADGVGVSSVVQTTTSTADSGENVVTMTLTDGSTATFKVRNGSRGSTGSAGAKGDKGDPFTYSDFTSEQLAALKGPKGDKGDKGDTGATGATGAAGAQGAKGDKGDTGATGPAGTSVTHSWNGTNLTLTSASGTTTTNLGLQYTISQTDLTAGVSALASGTLYFQYE